jgi:hypothetical protein
MQVPWLLPVVLVLVCVVLDSFDGFDASVQIQGKKVRTDSIFKIATVHRFKNLQLNACGVAFGQNTHQNRQYT